MLILAVVTDGVYVDIFNVCVEESDDEGHHVEMSRFVCITDRFVVETDHAGKVRLHMLQAHSLHAITLHLLSNIYIA